MNKKFDVVIIGGGLYGAYLAYSLYQQNSKLRIAILEAEPALFRKAARTNQGQLHMGYVYSADPELAVDCAKNASLFEQEFPSAVDRRITSYYGIHAESEITPEAYEEFCARVGLPLVQIDPVPRELFTSNIVAAYLTPEKPFNSGVLQQILLHRLGQANTTILCNHKVTQLDPLITGYRISAFGQPDLQAEIVVNVTFASINELQRRMMLPVLPIRYDTFLHFLIGIPREYTDISMSIVRGPYCFLVPSTYRDGHLLASAKFRRTAYAVDHEPFEDIDDALVQELYESAIMDAHLYLPCTENAQFRGHTLGTRAAIYAGNPKMYTSAVTARFDVLPNYHVLLGGKISCLSETKNIATQILERAGVFTKKILQTRDL